MAYRATALVLHCIDFRLGKAIKEYLEGRNLLNDCDVVAADGSAKNIVRPEKSTDAEFIMRQIDNARRLHQISEVVLINHTDCGAYGGELSFGSKEEEIAQHVTDMKAATVKIHEKYPDMVVRGVLAQISPKNEVRLDDID